MTGNKYAPLAQHLRMVDAAKVTMTFADIEVLIGASLPPSAHNHAEWWAARTPRRSQDFAWLGVGWEVDKADRDRKLVTFRKIN